MMPSHMTTLIIETFRLNGELLAAGDRLVGAIGLTSARWQVLGAIEMAPVPLPVAHIARNMGLSRQAVQRVANVLAAEGLVAFADNPHHARAKLAVLSASGKRVFEEAMARQLPWAQGLAKGIGMSDVKTAISVLRSVREKLQGAAKPREDELHVMEEHA
jgi:DNA-binding MarR family transcriptional regulator